MFDEYPDILTVQDLMKALCIGRNKAYSMLINKQIQSIRIGKSYRIPKSALIAFVLNTVSA